ncbi:MAG TPA: hypothetical protein VK908_05985 [Jiangellales bacterium]|nr:hypothetical protein [Jiangellales bacterium]
MARSTPPGLVEVADELYGVAPADFVRERDARVKQARERGDRDLAAAVRSLRRPTTAAWLANLLVRTERDQVEALLEIGDALREAESRLAGEELRELGAQRRQVVTALVQAARKAARADGHPVDEGVGWDLEATLTLALAGGRVAEAVRSGRLITAARHGAAEEGAVREALVSITAAPARPGGRHDDLADRRGRRRRADAEAASRRRQEAEAVLARAEHAHEQARRDLADAAGAERRAERAVRSAADEVADLEERLTRARVAVDAAERDLADARAARVESEQESAAAVITRSRAEEDLRRARASEEEVRG